jgi:O-antigen/teichoic acid export membrane protein
MAMQRFGYVNGRTIVATSANVIGATALVLGGAGLIPVLVLTTTVTAIASLGLAVLVNRQLGSVSVRPGLDRAALRGLLSFGGFRFLTELSFQVSGHLDRLLIAALLSVTAVSYYALPALIFQRVLHLVGQIGYAAFPSLSGEFHLGRQERAQDVYLRTSRLAAACMLPLSLFLAIEATPLLAAWAGMEVAENSSRTLQIFALGALLAALSGIPAMTNEALSRPQVTTAFAAVGAALSLGLGLALIPWLGIEGAAVALLVNSLLLQPPLIFLTNRSVGVSQKRWAGAVLLRPGLAAAAPTAALGAIAVLASDLVSVLLGGVVFASLYATAAYRFVLTADERRGVLHLLRRGLGGAKAALTRASERAARPLAGTVK